jgi:(S)-ureidoglycine-glyoxylate aminotransferase
VVHGETSTGVLQPLPEIARVCREHDALLLADAVVTLGGAEVATDAWGLDVAVGGTQKCLSCPSGLAPVTYNARAQAVLTGRRGPVRSNYLDLGQLQTYWSPRRFNHHTAPTAMVYGLREALRAVATEGLAARFARHRRHGDALRAGVGALGLTLFGPEPPAHRLPFVTPVVVPAGIDELRVRQRLLHDFGIEIGAAFGPLQGRIWRIGTMGWTVELMLLYILYNSIRRQVTDREIILHPCTNIGRRDIQRGRTEQQNPRQIFRREAIFKRLQVESGTCGSNKRRQLDHLLVAAPT